MHHDCHPLTGLLLAQSWIRACQDCVWWVLPYLMQFFPPLCSIYSIYRWTHHNDMYPYLCTHIWWVGNVSGVHVWFHPRNCSNKGKGSSLQLTPPTSTSIHAIYLLNTTTLALLKAVLCAFKTQATIHCANWILMSHLFKIYNAFQYNVPCDVMRFNTAQNLFLTAGKYFIMVLKN